MSDVQNFWKDHPVQIPQGGLVSANLLGELASADRPPTVIPLQVSDWADKVGNSLASIPQQAMQDKSGLLSLQREQAKTTTALTLASMAQTRLKNLQYPVDSNGNPIVDSSGNPVDQSKYLMTIGSNGESSIAPNPMTLAAQGQIFGNGPYIPNSNTPQQPQTYTQRQTVPSAPVPSTARPVYNAPVLQPLNLGSGSSNTANPQTFSLQSGQASAAQAAPFVAGSMLAGGNDTSSPSPLDDPNNLANRSHVTPEEAMAWGKQNWRTDIVSARQEFDGQGNATNRNILTLKDGTQQPLHSAYALANPGAGGWQSDLTTSPNPALAANPAALTAVASAPTAAAIQASGPNAPVPSTPAQSANISPLLASAMMPAAPTLAQKLQSGTINPQDVLSAGGSPWAGTRNAPPAPMPTPYQNAAWLNRIAATGEPTPAPTAPIVPRAQLVDRLTTLPPPEYPDDPGKKTFGLSAQEVLAQAQNAKQTGMDTSVPIWDSPNGPVQGKPSQTVPIIGKDGKPATGYIDPGGGGLVNASTVYTKQNYDYGEGRDYLDGSHKDVANVLGQAQDLAMMNMVVKNGFATPDQWNQWSWQQKESSYRLAANQENTTSNQPTNELLAKRMAILDSGVRLQDSLDALKTNADPNGVQARNAMALAFNAKANQFGSLVGIHDNPALSKAQAAYSDFLNTVRAQETNRPASDAEKVGVGMTDSPFSPGSIGNLSDQSFLPNLQTYLANQGRLMSRDVNIALSSKYRVNDSILHAANLVHMADNAVGSGPQNPIGNITSDAQRDKVPNGAYYKVGNTLYRKGM